MSDPAPTTPALSESATPAVPKSSTLRDIAATAGVHHSTLSRALRGHPRISAARTAELRALAKRMGYVPDPILGALMAYRTSRRPAAFHATIAWLNPSRKRADWRVYRAYNDYFEGASARARQLGFQLEEIILPTTTASGRTNESPQVRQDRVTSMLEARNIHAIIVGPAPMAGETLDLIDWPRFSAIRIGYSLASPRLHIVTANHSRAMTTLMRELHARGYRRPGLFITAELDERIGRQWSGAFLREQFDLPREDRLEPCFHETLTERVLMDWMKSQRPDVIVGMGDERVVAILHRNGWRIPEDIGLVVLAQPNKGVAITGIVEHNEEVGTTAVDMVVAMVNRQERGMPVTPQTVLIENGWREGGTLRLKHG
ncbi:LacI family DNA-binding transcriptional regulator [Geminisphaera colitermitum]|uniref:substrate-binding domain-containing protein n=1 Tax=Geminisphaera colitermitum TaxID=1148786 RepID=UPI0001964D33|nr:LacI family DNA-binding transcriptional regulator [Geminisphaera colitermitum]